MLGVGFSLTMERGTLSVDGSMFEGGGQILRIALCISGLTGRPLNIRNIRVGRPKPGLARSHLAALKTFAKITNTRLDQVKVGTREFTLHPKALSAGVYTAECETAGSCSLMFQCLFPLLLKTGSTAVVRGGTDVHFSPPSYFVVNVLKPTLAKMGIEFEYRVDEYGFEPTGGGEVLVTPIQTDTIQPLVLLEKGEIVGVTGEILLSRGRPKPGNSPFDHAFGETVIQAITDHLALPNVELTIKEVSYPSRCAVVSLIAHTSTGCLFHSSILEASKQLDAGRLGINAANDLLRELNGDFTVDSHIQDQTVLFMALATGESRVKTCEPTDHTKGALHLVETLLGAQVSYQDGVLTVQGIGR